MRRRVMKALGTWFLPPEPPYLLFINEAGVTAWDQRTAAQDDTRHASFDADSESGGAESSLSDALDWVAQRAGHSQAFVYPILGGSYSWADFRPISGHDQSNLDVAGRLEATICELARAPERNADQSSLQYIRWFIDRKVATRVADICAERNIRVIALDSLERFIGDVLADDSRVNEGIVVRLPHETALIKCEAGQQPQIVSETHAASNDCQNESSALSHLTENTLSIEKLVSLAGKKGISSPVKAIGEISRDAKLKDICTEHLRYKLSHWSTRMARIAVALSVVLLLSGITMSFKQSSLAEENDQLGTLMSKRDRLRTLALEKAKTESESYPVPGLSAATALGRLGQEKIEGIQLTSITIGRQESGSVTVVGLADNEAQVFGYLESMRVWFRGYTVTLSSIEKPPRSRTGKLLDKKQFKIEVTA